MKGVAFCPAHVTGFFKAELDEKSSLEELGSQGAGFSIQKGVKTTVLVRKKTVYDDSNFHLNILGYQTDNVEVSEFVIKKFLRLVGKDVFVDIKVDASTETRCKVVSLGVDYAKVEVVFRFEVDETGAG